MSDPSPLPAPPGPGGGALSGPGEAPRTTDLADGDWHRLHPASPLLRGGLVFLAILGFLVANLRERLVEFFLAIFGGPGVPSAPPGVNPDEFDPSWAEDPVSAILVHGLVGWALLAVLLIVLAVIAGYALAWRMHTFRVTPDAVEVRSGILFRSHRSARLDRVQGINVSRPLFARIFGAAKLEVTVAGQSGNVQLAYLGSALADGLRRDILRMASGARAAAARRAGAPGRGADAAQGAGPASVAGAGAVGASGVAEASRAAAAREFVTARVDELLAPELDPELAPPESIVHLPLARVIGSTLLSGATVWLLGLVGVIIWGGVAGSPWVLFSFVPATIGLVSYYWSRITRSLRYTIAGTADGVRIGHGLLSTSNQTIPPGRVHAIEVSQWILWRPFGWWTIRINVAGQSLASGDAVQRTTILPVGTLDDVRRVLGLIVPDSETALGGLVEPGLVGGTPGGGFSGAPRRAAWIRPFSWRRTGWSIEAGIVLIRRGALTRRLVLVPLARMQSVALSQGLIRRALGLVDVRVHTVTGPVSAQLPVAEGAEGHALFERLARDAVALAGSDRSHAWGVPADAP